MLEALSFEESTLELDLVPVDQNEDNHTVVVIGFVVVVAGSVVGYLIYYYVSNSQKPSEDSQKPTEEFEDPSKQTGESGQPKKPKNLK